VHSKSPKRKQTNKEKRTFSKSNLPCAQILLILMWPNNMDNDLGPGFNSISPDNKSIIWIMQNNVQIFWNVDINSMKFIVQNLNVNLLKSLIAALYKMISTTIIEIYSLLTFQMIYNSTTKYPTRCENDFLKRFTVLNWGISMQFLCDNYVLLLCFKRKKVCHASRHAVQNKAQQAKTVQILSDFKLWKCSKTFLIWYETMHYFELSYFVLHRRAPQQGHKHGRSYIYTKNIEISFAYNFWKITSFELKFCQNKEL